MKMVRNLLLLIIIIISNTTQAQVYNYLDYKLLPIPTYSHDEPIQVFYEGEKPTKPYFKLVILENSITDSKGTFTSLIKELKQEAQNIGADAIIVHKMGTNIRTSTDSEGYQISINVKEIIVFGIKYKDNLDYLTIIPKKVSIYEVMDSTDKMLKVADYTQGLNQEIIHKNNHSNLYKLLKPFSLNHLIFERENWQYSLNKNRIHERRLLNNQGVKVKTVLFAYDKQEFIKIITIRKKEAISTNYQLINQNKAAHMRRKNHNFISQKVMIDYNENGTIHLKKNYPNLNKSNIYYEEIFSYDSLGKLSQKQVFKVNNNIRTELGKFVYETYYTVEEVKEQFPELQD